MERERELERAESRCPFCHDALGTAQDAIRCETCGAAHHRACWQELGACASCRRVAPVMSADKLAVSARLSAVEQDGVLTIACSRRDKGSWVAVPVLLVLLFAASAGVLGGLGELHRGHPVGFAPLLLCGVLGAFFALGIANSLAGVERIVITADTVGYTHHVLGVPLPFLGRRVPRSSVTEVRAEPHEVILMTGGRKAITLSILEPDEAAWVAARLRRHLGLGRQ